jgi:SAM-dependent methyltransferase
MRENDGENVALDPVEAQYERWVIPPRIHDLSLLPLTSPKQHYQDPRTLYWLYWPQSPFREDLDILVAGCGSIAAAAQAFLFPKARVWGIDFSRAALEHEEFLKQKHNLANLTLRHARLEDAAALGQSFDLIVCYGVLNHLIDPATGLRALGQCLRRDGVIDLMVYGKHGRGGVTILQEMFRGMGVQQDPGGVRVVKDTLKALLPNHPMQSYRPITDHELSSDEGLVDTFLSRRDRPFSCGECLDLVREAGLVFQGWKENGQYHLDTRLSPQDPLWSHLQGLDQRQYWQAVEMLDPIISAHWFHACRADRDPATYRIQFDDDAFLGYIPVPRVSQSVPADRLRRQPALIARPPFPPMILDNEQAAVFRHMDGARSVRECLTAAGLTGESATALAHRFFSKLWRVGYVLFRLPKND